MRKEEAGSSYPTHVLTPMPRATGSRELEQEQRLSAHQWRSSRRCTHARAQGYLTPKAARVGHPQMETKRREDYCRYRPLALRPREQGWPLSSAIGSKQLPALGAPLTHPLTSWLGAMVSPRDGSITNTLSRVAVRSNTQHRTYLLGDLVCSPPLSQSSSASGRSSHSSVPGS